MNPDLKWEMVAGAGLTILIAKLWPRLSAVPVHLKVIHFGFITLFSLVSIRGIQVLIIFCAGHEHFANMFSGRNLPGITGAEMQILAIIYAVMGSALYFATMTLGNFHKRALGPFTWLVFPTALTYPMVIAAMVDVNSRSPLSIVTLCSVFALLLGAGCAAIAFYRSKIVATRFV